MKLIYDRHVFVFNINRFHYYIVGTVCKLITVFITRSIVIVTENRHKHIILSVHYVFLYERHSVIESPLCCSV